MMGGMNGMGKGMGMGMGDGTGGMGRQIRRESEN